MSLFIGDFVCKADNKGRVVVPASFRRGMEAAGQAFFVLRRNVFEACIDMYPRQEWEEMVRKLKARLNLFNPKHAAFFREFHRGTQEVEMDANGRILLPRRLLEEVGIDKEMVMAAQESFIQIWETEAYAKIAVDGETLGRMAEEIFKD